MPERTTRHRSQKTGKRIWLLAIWVLLTARVASSDAPEPPASELSWIAPRSEAPGLEQRIFESKAAGARVSYHVLLPEAYESEGARRFPVLYWLHGGGAGEAGPAALARIFGDASRQGKIPPMIVVFPYGLPNGMWCDSKDGRTPVETILIRELIPEVDARFRTIASREGRMIEGFSMGGYGAARLGFQHPDLFSAVSILGGGPLQPTFDPAVGPRRNAGLRARLLQSVYGGDQAYFKALSPWHLAEKNADALRGRTRIRIGIGEQDFTLPANRDFSAHLTRLNIPHDFNIAPGVEHKPNLLLRALGEPYWKFYRDVFGNPMPPSDMQREKE